MLSGGFFKRQGSHLTSFNLSKKTLGALFLLTAQQTEAQGKGHPEGESYGFPSYIPAAILGGVSLCIIASFCVCYYRNRNQQNLLNQPLLDGVAAEEDKPVHEEIDTDTVKADTAEPDTLNTEIDALNTEIDTAEDTGISIADIALTHHIPSYSRP